MAKIKALKNFAGTVSMSVGQVIDCGDDAVVNDLVKAGYVEVQGENKGTVTKRKTSVAKN